MIDSISLDKIFWGQLSDGRLSFSFEGLPDNIHLPISWANPKKINFHITKNTGDGTNKPKIVIAVWDKELVDAFMPYIPAIVITKMYKPLSFNKYSRRDRKNIRIVYFDEVQELVNMHSIEQRISGTFRDHSVVKRKRLKIMPSAESAMVSLLKNLGLANVFINNQRSVKRDSFNGTPCRTGIVFLWNQKHHFVTFRNQCYVLQRKRNIQELLMTFMNADLVRDLTNKVDAALKEIINAEVYIDTTHLNSPVRFYLEFPKDQKEAK